MTQKRKRMHRHKSRKPKMTDERRGYIEAHMEIAADFPDGAFWGYMQEMGIDPEETLELSDEADE